MYSNPVLDSAIVFAGFPVLGLFCLIHARVRTRTIDVLEQRGSVTVASVIGIRFKPLFFRRLPSYGVVRFTYEYKGKSYTRRQAIEEFSAQMLSKDLSTHAHVLLLPEKPRCARLVYTDRIVYSDPTIDSEKRTGIACILIPFLYALSIGVVFLIVYIARS